MLVRELEECSRFVAGDNTLLREVMHPRGVHLDLRYSLAHAVLPAGGKSLPHTLRSSEVYYILSGEGTIFVNGESAPLREGTTVFVSPGAVQHVENTGPSELAFLCIVDPPWRAEDEEILG